MGGTLGEPTGAPLADRLSQGLLGGLLGLVAAFGPLAAAAGERIGVDVKVPGPSGPALVDPEVTGPADARPPLLAQAHPGPTADAKARLDLRIQFFTSRGFAVVEVNYAGSTGYGRGYRERLTGQWGVLDVADCLDAARSLIQAGEVDGRRLVIAGESAGGFTALCALASEEFSRSVSAGSALPIWRPSAGKPPSFRP
jgi:predicted dienelactone hydrolase